MVRTLILCLLFLFSINTSYAQDHSENITSSNWKGFEKISFSFKDRAAFLVKPKNPLPGNPWVWRARFPGWHTEADSILVAEGFHITYINTNNLYGSPGAVAIWNEYYDYMVEQFDLNQKVALAGVSRGGLFIYNWAKENTGKVSCIYAEAPVCDFKSWPAGWGEGKGSPRDWENLKKEYGFTSDDEARAYLNNPFDNLEGLARAKVPILHMISLKDKIVPSQENTFVLVNRYLSLGGIARVVPCTEGKQNLEGHHFPIETPRLVADFIKYYSR